MLMNAHEWTSLSGSDVAGWGIAVSAWYLLIHVNSMELGNGGQQPAMLIVYQACNR